MASWWNGRRAGLKIPCPQGHVGSSPTEATNLMFGWVESLWDKVTGPEMVTPEEIEGSLHLPVLAIIPHLERRASQPAGRQVPNPTHGSVMRRIDLEGRW